MSNPVLDVKMTGNETFTALEGVHSSSEEVTFGMSKHRSIFNESHTT